MKSVLILLTMCVAANAMTYRGPPHPQGGPFGGDEYPGSPGSPGMHGGESDDDFDQSPEPQDPRGCMRNCIGPDKCLSRREIDSLPRRCLNCIDNRCDDINPHNRSAVLDCISGARQSCPRCPTLNANDRARAMKCKTCSVACPVNDRRGSESDSDSPGSPGRRGSRGPPKKGDIKAMRKCFMSCAAAGNCTTIKQAKMQMKMARKECKECVMDECGAYDRSNRSEIVACISDAREDCDECPAVLPKEQMKKKQCKACLRTCAPKGGKGIGFGGRPPIPGRGPSRPRKQMARAEFLANLVFCLRTRAVCTSCPSARELRMKMRNVTAGCTSCVFAECGKVDYTDKNKLALCLFDAKRVCDECPVISEQEQMQRKTCSKCRERCHPFKGLLGSLGKSGPRTPPGGFPIPPVIPTHVVYTPPITLNGGADPSHG